MASLYLLFVLACVSIVWCEDRCQESPWLCNELTQMRLMMAEQQLVNKLLQAKVTTLLHAQTARLTYLEEELASQAKSLSRLRHQCALDRAELYDLTAGLNSGIKSNASPRPRTITQRSDDAGPLEAVVNQMGQQLMVMSADIQALKNTDQTLLNANHQQDLNIQDARTSTFVHWGSSQCPNDSQLVYSGVVGGSDFSHSGAATNYLCLTKSPVAGPTISLHFWAYLYGAEYETWDSTHHDKDPVCSMCRSSHSTTIMIPGTNVCTQGWTQQYSGYLMAGEYDHVAGTEYICVDSALESRPGSDDNHNGALLYYTVTTCGSLPCEPYINNRVVTCVVCSL